MVSPEHTTQPGLAPFRIEPRYVERVWGFRDLHPWYDRTAEPGEPIGEVWLTGDECVVATGAHAGQTLGDLFEKVPAMLLGADAAKPASPLPIPSSPLLIKVIFAKEKLSVQVHPDDEMARKYGQPRGKTECWYALAAEPGALVAVGLKHGVSLEKVRQGIEAGTLEESLNMMPVAAGEMILVDAGTVHAIWPGSILLETQQNCDITYRMYDYGRGRELHIERSLEALRFETRAGKVQPKVLKDRTVLIDSAYFCMERLSVDGSRGSTSLTGESSAGLAYLFAAAGAARIVGAGIEPVELPARGIVAVPASSPEFAIQDLGGLDLIRIVPNWPQNGRAIGGSDGSV
jgi:mannose-6-phosphate isomerase